MITKIPDFSDITHHEEDCSCSGATNDDQVSHTSTAHKHTHKQSTDSTLSYCNGVPDFCAGYVTLQRVEQQQRKPPCPHVSRAREQKVIAPDVEGYPATPQSGTTAVTPPFAPQALLTVADNVHRNTPTMVVKSVF